MTLAQTRLPDEVVRSLDTLPRLLRHRAEQHGDRTAFRYKDLGIWQKISWRQYRERVEAFCLGLRSLGLAPGDRLAIQSENRPQWVFADLATQTAGAIVVGVYPTNPPAELGYLLQDCGARILIAEDQEQVDKALAVFDSCPDLTRIVVIDTKGLRSYQHPALVTYADIEAHGRSLMAAEPALFDALVDGTSATDISCLVYTSGTTGPPKGAVLTHQNCLAGARGLADGTGITPQDSAVSYLPLCHVAERMWTLFISLQVGVTINFAESVETVQRDIYEIAPTFFGAVPRIAEKMQAGVEMKMQDAAWLKRKNYDLWIKVGRRLAAERLARGGRLSLPSRLLYGLGWLFLYRALRDRLGLRNVRHCLVGSAAVAPEILEYFHAIGVRMVQAYGQTECGGASHQHRGWDIAYDTVGVPLPGYECKLDTDTGEILLRGAGIFAGYWKSEQASAAACPDGWLRTGDLGALTEAGHLRIIGRVKDIIITAGGKNIAPQNIENALKCSPYVREAVVIGEARRYLTALIGIEYDTVGHWAQQHGIPYTTYGNLASRQEVVDLVASWVTKVNNDLSQVETLKRFRLLTKELDHDDGELTATQKVRRAAIAAQFEAEIAEMYR